MLNIKPNFATLGTDFFSIVKPTPIPNPSWIHINQDLVKELGIQEFKTNEWLEILSGNKNLADYDPLASIYAGHQFGYFVPQLGDGRAILIAEHLAPNNKIWELQLKGAGITPYSRGADGRAVLRSSIREYLCSHAMHSLGIPSTQALAIIGAPFSVQREKIETAAIVLRVAPSFIRFGHFQLFASRKQTAQVKKLVDFVMDNYYPECNKHEDKYLSWFKNVVNNTANTIAKWQAIGFCHGVMNSDNMSILGLTLDYGPFAFLDQFNPNYICNHSDSEGRYAYANQPQIAWWNLHRLAESLESIISQDELQAALDGYALIFNQYYLTAMGKKLGILDFTQNDIQLLKDLLAILAESGSDWTIFWRQLSYLQQNDRLTRQKVIDENTLAEEMNQWLERYLSRRSQQNSSFTNQQQVMLKNNPKFILRNYLAQIAIEKAENGDFSEINQLYQILAKPYDEQQVYDSYATYPPQWAKCIELSCSS